MTCSEGVSKRIHYGEDRDIYRDSFELCLSQWFMGPMEVQLPKDQFVPLIFSYKEHNHEKINGKFPFGVVQCDGLNRYKEYVYFRMMLQYIEQIQVVPPKPDINAAGVIVMQISREARTALRKNFSISKDFIKTHYPLNHASIVDAFRPWNEANYNHILRYKSKKKKGFAFENFEELQSRISNWLKIIREEDISIIKAKGNLQTEEPFFKILSQMEWDDLLKKLNIRCEYSPNFSEYKYFHPEYNPPNTQPKHVEDVEPMPRSQEQADNNLVTTPKRAGSNKENELKNGLQQLDSAAPPTKRRKGLITLDDDEGAMPSSSCSTNSAQTSQTLATKCTNLVRYGSGKENISLCFGDVEKLAPDQLLNDSIIEFYLRFLTCEYFPLERSSEIYIFNTFLFPRLIQNPTKSVFCPTRRGTESRRKWLQRNYEFIKRWTRGVDIFTKKILVIPVNFEEHWYVMIVLNPGKAIRPNNILDQAVKPENSATIFVLNSLHMINCKMTSLAATILKEYLVLEYNDKHKDSKNYLSPAHLVEVAVKDVSGQLNLVDCGVYLLAYTELFLMWTPKLCNFVFNFNEWWPLFRESQMQYMRYKILAVLRSKVAKHVWMELRRFEEEESKKKLIHFCTEDQLKKSLQAKGLRRWHSCTDIKQIFRPPRKRCKSLHRRDPDDHLNVTYDPFDLPLGTFVTTYSY